MEPTVTINLEDARAILRSDPSGVGIGVISRLSCAIDATFDSRACGDNNDDHFPTPCSCSSSLGRHHDGHHDPAAYADSSYRHSAAFKYIREHG